MGIEFFSEETDFLLTKQESYSSWVESIAQSHSAEVNQINYIFCSDDYLLKINQEYLKHDYFTDIISFPYAESPDPLEGDIFISVDMVKENAEKNEVSFENELLRVMAHGILHFLGFKDKSTIESKEMREKEDVAIALFNKVL